MIYLYHMEEYMKYKINKKELIITIIVLIIAIFVGFLGGKALYDAMNGAI